MACEMFVCDSAKPVLSLESDVSNQASPSPRNQRCTHTTTQTPSHKSFACSVSHLDGHFHTTISDVVIFALTIARTLHPRIDVVVRLAITILYFKRFS